MSIEDANITNAIQLVDSIYRILEHKACMRLILGNRTSKFYDIDKCLGFYLTSENKNQQVEWMRTASVCLYGHDYFDETVITTTAGITDVSGKGIFPFTKLQLGDEYVLASGAGDFRSGDMVLMTIMAYAILRPLKLSYAEKVEDGGYSMCFHTNKSREFNEIVYQCVPGWKSRTEISTVFKIRDLTMMAVTAYKPPTE